MDSVDVDFGKHLERIYAQLNSAERLQDVLWRLEKDLLDLLQADRMTIYQRDRHGKEIVSMYRTGNELMEEIRLPLSPTSLAGYVAMSRNSLKIDDVYDTDFLTSVHPKLHFDYSYDQSTGYLTTSMLIIPIKFKSTLLGVLQVINRRDGTAFTEEDLAAAEKVAEIIGERFRYDLKTTLGPFDYLIQTGRITLEELEEYEEKALEENLPMTLLITKHTDLTPDDLGISLEQYYQVPFFRYDPDLSLDQGLVESLNKDYLASNRWIPLLATPDRAVILIDDPNDGERIMEIQTVLNAASYEFLVGLPEDIMKFLGIDLMPEIEIAVANVNMEDLVGQLESEVDKLALLNDEGDGELLNPNESTIIQLVNKIIANAIEIGASDIHIEPSKGAAPADVRMRLDGVCRVVLQVPQRNVRAVVARIKVMSRLDITEVRKPQDGKMGVKLRGTPIELRVATLPTVQGESVVMRVLAAGEPLPFGKLNLSKRNEQEINEAIQIPYGLFLVVGPTGSGKTTTLHAVLGVLNNPDRKILTAEDPVEITQQGLQQVQVHPKIGYTFAIALRAFLRCDPDVILIGEMRDYETAHSGIEASLTGHMVFSTLHTNSAPETITRLLDMGLDPMNFADALVGVLAQRLIRTLCSKCKEEYQPDAEHVEKLRHLYGEEWWGDLNIDPNQMVLCKPRGCDACANSGYKGRTGIHEVLIATPEMKKMIALRTPVAEIKTLAMRQGMRSLVQDGIQKIIRGQTDLIQLRKITATN